MLLSFCSRRYMARLLLHEEQANLRYSETNCRTSRVQSGTQQNNNRFAIVVYRSKIHVLFVLLTVCAIEMIELKTAVSMLFSWSIKWHCATKFRLPRGTRVHTPHINESFLNQWHPRSNSLNTCWENSINHHTLSQWHFHRFQLPNHNKDWETWFQ